MKLNLGCGDAQLEGFVNLDKRWGWCFEDGLGQYADGSIEAITESHALMYLLEPEWPAIFAEMARVLEPGGVVRITEDDTVNPLGHRFGGRRPVRGAYVCPCPCSAELVIRHLEQAGLVAGLVAPGETAWRDTSLIQQLHGQPPDVFHVEGVKPGGAAQRPSL